MNTFAKFFGMAGLFALALPVAGQELADNSNSLAYGDLSDISVRDTRYTSMSNDYPVGINQVFVLNSNRADKNYVINSSYARPVTIHIYGKTGQLLTRIKYLLESGDNYVGRDLLQQLPPDKYTVLVSDASNANIAATMSVMY